MFLKLEFQTYNFDLSERPIPASLKDDANINLQYR